MWLFACLRFSLIVFAIYLSGVCLIYVYNDFVVFCVTAVDRADPRVP